MTISSRGTITDTRPRKNIHIPLYLKLFLFIPELGFTALGTFWAFDDASDCQVSALNLTPLNLRTSLTPTASIRSEF